MKLIISRYGRRSSDSIKSAGIEDLQIYRVENRLFMIMEVNDDFSFESEK